MIKLKVINNTRRKVNNYYWGYGWMKQRSFHLLVKDQIEGYR